MQRSQQSVGQKANYEKNRTHKLQSLPFAKAMKYRASLLVATKNVKS